MQVAPGVWVAPDCSPTRRTIRASPFVGKRASGSVRSFHGSLRANVDLRRSGLDGPIKNQEMVGVCWSFAISTVMDNAIRRTGGQEVIAPLHVLSSKVWDDIWTRGRSSRELTVEPSWPYDPAKGCKLNESESEVWCGKTYQVEPGSWRRDPALVAELERANRSGIFRISSVESVGADQIAPTVASGSAVYAAFDYSRTAWADDGSAGNVITDYVESDGGHAVVVVGYRTLPTGRQFLLHNSWGSRWRDSGYAWISESMVRLHLRDAFTLDVAGSAAPPAQTPVPAPAPQTGCPPGHARDGVLGWCAPLCPNGAAPNAMLCTPSRTSSCASGQVRDLLHGACGSPCRSGLPPTGGICVF